MTSIIAFPKSRSKVKFELRKWERCRVPFWVRVFRPRTDFGQTLRARDKNGRWLYMREGDRDL